MSITPNYTTNCCKVLSKLKHENINITTNAGEFNCLEQEMYAMDLENEHQFEGRSYYYFSNGIGDVTRKISFVSGGDLLYEKRLFSYSIELKRGIKKLYVSSYKKTCEFNKLTSFSHY